MHLDMSQLGPREQINYKVVGSIRPGNRAALIGLSPATVLLQQTRFARVVLTIVSKNFREHGNIPQGQVKTLCAHRVNGMGRITEDDQPVTDILFGTYQFQRVGRAFTDL